MLNQTQLFILKSLAYGKKTLAELARETGYTKPSLQAQLMRLERKGLITRHKMSAKKIYYSILSRSKLEEQIEELNKSLFRTIYTPAYKATKKIVLVSSFNMLLTREQRDYFDANFTFQDYPEREDQVTPELFVSRYKEAEVGMISQSFGFLNARILSECKKLRQVICLGKPAHFFDKELFKKLGIGYQDLSYPDTNFIRGSSTEFLIKSVLDILRPTRQAEEELKFNNRFTGIMGLEQLGEELFGQRIGIIGVESSAKMAAPILRLLGAKTFFADPECGRIDPYELEVEKLYSVEDLFSLADVVIYTDNCYGSPPNIAAFMNSHMRMRYLLILGEYHYDKEFMLRCREHILSGKLKGIHLDYRSSRYEKEGCDERLELLYEIMNLPNVHLTPFVGPTTLQSTIRRNDYVIEILQRIIEGKE